MFLRPSTSRAAIRSAAAASTRLIAVESSTSVVETAASTITTGRRLLSTTSSKASSVVPRQRQSVAVAMSRSKVMNSNNYNSSIGRWFSSKSEAEEKKEADAESPAEAAEENTADEAAAASAESSSNKEDELNKQIKDLKDQLLRSYAEQENIRHIARNDVQAANSFAIKKFAKSLLDVADNLDRALDAVGEDQQNTPEFQSFFQGIELTKSGLVKALQSNGVTPFCEEPGDIFDPEQHEALMEYPDPTSTPGTVGQVIKKGYMLNGRVLRPAEVGVVKK